jgi:hypothetical protein
MKPCFLFNGEEWEQVEELVKFKNIILDLYHGQVADSVNLAGLEHVIVCTVGPAAEAGGLPTVLFRTYGIQLKKSGTRLPRAELEEMGPSFDFVIRRTRFATPDVWKTATRVPRELQVIIYLVIYLIFINSIFSPRRRRISHMMTWAITMVVYIWRNKTSANFKLVR